MVRIYDFCTRKLVSFNSLLPQKRITLKKNWKLFNLSDEQTKKWNKKKTLTVQPGNYGDTQYERKLQVSGVVWKWIWSKWMKNLTKDTWEEQEKYELCSKNLNKGLKTGTSSIVRYLGLFLNRTREEELGSLNHKTKKLMSMHKSLHSKDN